MTPRLAKQFAKNVYIFLDPLNIALYRAFHHYDGPIPPAPNRIRIGCISISKFRKSGWNSYDPIQRAIDKYYGRTEGRVLDFGCGAGRILQFFQDKSFELHGCDVDRSAVEFVSKTLPAVRATANKFEPPLDYPDGHFDIIYSVSIWTHLPPPLQEPWLREMRRVLKPGGIALLTTIGPHGYQRGTHLQAVTFTLDELLRTGFQHSPYIKWGGSPGTGASYGAAYHTPAYIRKEWARIFEVVDVEEGAVDDLNDLVVLR